MNRIEFFGVPGVGKSTLYQELKNKRGKDDNWIDLEEAKLLISKKLILEGKNKGRLLYAPFKKAIFLLNISKDVQKRISSEIIPGLAKSALSSKKKDWLEFIDYCANKLSDNNKDPLYRFYLAEWFLTAISEVALTEECSLPSEVLIDESLAQRATGLLSWDIELAAKQSIEYFQLIPAPKAVIYLHADLESIFKRNLERMHNRNILQHRGLSKKELRNRLIIIDQVCTKGVEVLANRGIPIIEVNAKCELQQNVTHVKKQLKSINLTP